MPANCLNLQYSVIITRFVTMHALLVPALQTARHIELGENFIRFPLLNRFFPALMQ